MGMKVLKTFDDLNRHVLAQVRKSYIFFRDHKFDEFLYTLHCTVKTAADVLGFLLISLATLYLAYKNAIYKGPRQVVSHFQFAPNIKQVYSSRELTHFTQQNRAILQRLSRREQ